MENTTRNERECDIVDLEVAGDGVMAGGRRRGDEHAIVDESSKGSANERADPVHPVVGKVHGDQGGAEGASGVHRRAGEGSPHEDLGEHGETNRQGGDHSHGSLLRIHCSREHNKHESEGEHCLHEHGGPRGHADSNGVARDILTGSNYLQHPCACISMASQFVGSRFLDQLIP